MLYAAETLLIAAAGAGAFRLIGFPGGLVAGSMLAVAIAALVGRPVRLPAPLARVCFVLVGILLGAVVTPATVSGIATWPLSLALLIVAAMAMLVCTGCYLYWVHGWDPLSALLGAESGLDGAGTGALRRARRRPARHCHRACHARAADRARRACGPFLVWGQSSRRSPRRPPPQKARSSPSLCLSLRPRLRHSLCCACVFPAV